MKSLSFGVLALLVATLSVATAQSAKSPGRDRERLIGAWHLVHIESSGAQGAEERGSQPLGILIYTRDGHVSVQLMYPQAQHDLNNQYIHDGYEASFGSYDINETTHTLTHHVQGSNTGAALLGKDLTRNYQFTADGHLILRPANSQEHWSVMWEHY